MPYIHFGKQADIWKHLTLCEIMITEQPNVYIETNSASPSYRLSKTPEQQYGIYNFINKAKDNKQLIESIYYSLEKVAFNGGMYLGSPGLAMSVLGDIANEFIFFDIEPEPLKNIKEFAKHSNLDCKIKTINQDSVIGLLNLLPSLSKSSLIHFDPYYINKPSSNGYNYLDLFVKAAEQGLKCFLWYGFNTLDDKKKINDFLLANLTNRNMDNVSCVELIMEIIQKDTIPCNPGILGSGVLTSNLSKSSILSIMHYSQLLVDLYKGTHYESFNGDLYQDIVNINYGINPSVE